MRAARIFGRILKEPRFGMPSVSNFSSAPSCTGGFSNSKFKVALCQTAVDRSKDTSLANIRVAVEKAALLGADVAILGEMMSCPYSTKCFREYSEQPEFSDGVLANGENAPTCKLLSELALVHKLWVVGGSLPELDGAGNLYNTCLVFNPSGQVVARHRKVHLFDIDVAATEERPAMKFKESDVLSAGSTATFVDLPWCRIGVGICYDVRFPEYALSMRKQGAKFLVFPGAFNMTTGPAHWAVIARGRAVDTQCYIAMVSPSRSPDKDDYQAWGHSTLVGPWADVVAEAGAGPDVLITEVDPSEVDRVRAQVPTSTQKRKEIYIPFAHHETDIEEPDVKRSRL